jgi:hypothetical protein
LKQGIPSDSWSGVVFDGTLHGYKLAKKEYWLKDS